MVEDMSRESEFSLISDRNERRKKTNSTVKTFAFLALY